MSSLQEVTVMTVERGSWGSKMHFLATCIGFATGLGNLWRFPALAYENGGGAFLIPYIIASFTIGFPLLYLELSIGQFARVGPARCFRLFKPVFQGVGWAGIVVAYVVGIYYNMINVYSAIYLKQILTGRAEQWMLCNNEWNSDYCQSTLEDANCASKTNHSLTYYFNGTCWSDDYRLLRKKLVDSEKEYPPFSSVEEYFENYVHEKGTGLEDVFRINWQLLIGFALIWIVTAFTLLRGVNWIGKISQFTATVPYLIITCIFVRAITLDGAEIGLRFFITRPDLSYLFSYNTWLQAAIQICYTLAIGFGGLLSLSSYNDVHHNCFKDALIVVGFDSFMSVFGGTAAFCTMGFLAKQNNLPLNSVIQSGTTLTFVAYPEAMGKMPLPTLWSFAFFLMFFLLGVSSQFGMTECMCSGLEDQFPSLHRHKAKVAVLVCTSSFVLGLPICTRGGIFWFNLMNEYAGTFALFAVAFAEVCIIAHAYGIHEYRIDLRLMMGTPKRALAKLFGSSGKLILLNWTFLAPVLLFGLFIFSLVQYIGYRVTYGKLRRQYVFPDWAGYFGWALAVAPLVMIPLFALINIISFQRRKGNWRDAFKLHPKLSSYNRISAKSLTNIRLKEQEDCSFHS